MILLIKDHCPHCPKDLEAMINQLNGNTFKVIQHPDGSSFIQLNNKEFSPLPKSIIGLPALIVKEHLYMGETPIRDFLSSQFPTLWRQEVYA